MFINYKSEIYALARLNLSTASLKCLKLCKNSPALCFFLWSQCVNGFIVCKSNIQHIIMHEVNCNSPMSLCEHSFLLSHSTGRTDCYVMLSATCQRQLSFSLQLLLNACAFAVTRFLFSVFEVSVSVSDTKVFIDSIS